MCSCLYFNFIQEHLSFLFPLFTNSLYFSCFTFIYTSTFTLFFFFMGFLLRLNKYNFQIYSLLDANSQFSIGQEIDYNKAFNIYFIILQDCYY